MNRKLLWIIFMVFISNICFGDCIEENIHDGRWLLLDDCSMWEVDPFDRIDSSLWLSMSEVVVLNSDNGSLGYDYLMVNTDDKEKVHVKPMRITDRHWLRENVKDGTILILEDGSIWQVDSIDAIDSSLWLVSSDIYVVEDTYGYLLINTDDGEAVHATHLVL